MSRCEPTRDSRVASCPRLGVYRGTDPFPPLLDGSNPDWDWRLARCAPAHRTVFLCPSSTWEFLRFLPSAQDADLERSAIPDVPSNMPRCEPTKDSRATSCRHPGGYRG